MSNQPDPATRPATICPLARERDGTAIQPPDGMVAWRVRRKTGGRPRIQLGVDKQPMQLPPSYSIVDLEDILAPGAYFLDAVDAKGEPLGLTIPISLGELRNADGDDDEDDDPVAVSPMLPTSGSETRLVLEANVRATQMAFLHNQKTLELALRTAETLREGVQSLATAQADWIKSVASARGFFRNAPPLQLPPPTQASNEDAADDDGDDDDDDEYDEPPVPKSALDAVLEQLAPAIPVIVPQIVSWCTNAMKGGGVKGPKIDIDWMRDPFDWRRIQAKRNAAMAAEAAPVADTSATAPASQSATIGDPLALFRALPPELVPKLMTVKGMLSDDEQSRSMALLLALKPEDIPLLVAHIQPMSTDELLAFLRAQLAVKAA